MIFTLIKNEIIKILKKPKTIIIFSLFLVFVAGMIFIDYKNDEYTRYYNTPDGKIETLKSQKSYFESRLKEIDNVSSVDYDSTKNQINTINEKIQKQEQIKASGNTKDYWKEDLIEQKEDLNKSLEEGLLTTNEKNNINKRIDEIDTILEKGKRPVEEWEFNAINFAKGFMETVGFVILVLGIGAFMSDIVSGESTPATLKFLLVQPISRGKVILSKFIAVVLVVVTMICGSEILGFLGVGAFKGFNGADELVTVGTKYEWTTSEETAEKVISQVANSGHDITRAQEIIQMFGLQILFIITCCAFIMLISTIFKSSMVSMAVSLIISVGSTMICTVPSVGKRIAHLIFLNYGSPAKIIEGNIAVMFGNTNFAVSFAIALMFIITIISYALSHIVFCKKDMLV